jgi:membrane-bound serine protease (ClpP class)
MRSLIVIVCFILWPSLARAQAAPRVLVATYAGIISPVASEYMIQAVEKAQKEGYEALVLQLDTPGGLDLSMRTIVQAILACKVPVIVYVHPPGARATSAGVFIVMAAHVAAMAPGTNIGAAHPVMIGSIGGPSRGGKDRNEEIMEGKAVADAAAYLKSIAQKRGRNQSWAFEAVSKSTSITSSDAVKAGVVDLVASDIQGLLKSVDGRKIPDISKPLHTSGAVLVHYEMTRRQRWLAALSDPNVAMILMSLGAGGLFIELYNPGLILPGVVGVVALILAFYSFHTLSASYAGILLILAGLLFFLLEIKVTSYGMLALGGIASTLLGVLILFQQQPLGGLGVSWTVIYSSLSGLLGLTALLSYIVYKAYQRKTSTGPEGMLLAEGEAITDLTPLGKVSVLGEIWDAQASGASFLEKGASIIVEAVEGMRLRVRKKQG